MLSWNCAGLCCGSHPNSDPYGATQPRRRVYRDPCTRLAKQPKILNGTCWPGIADRTAGDHVAIQDEPLDPRPLDRHRMDLHNCHSPSLVHRLSPEPTRHGSRQNEAVQGEHRGGVKSHHRVDTSALFSGRSGLEWRRDDQGRASAAPSMAVEDVGVCQRDLAECRPDLSTFRHLSAGEDPDIGSQRRSRWVRESLRHDARDRVGLAVEHHRTTDGRRVAAEVPLPEAVAHHGHVTVAGGGAGREDRSQDRPDAQQLKEVRRNAVALHKFRIAARRLEDVVADTVESRHPLEDLLPIGPPVQIRSDARRDRICDFQSGMFPSRDHRTASTNSSQVLRSGLPARTEGAARRLLSAPVQRRKVETTGARVCLGTSGGRCSSSHTGIEDGSHLAGNNRRSLDVPVEHMRLCSGRGVRALNL